MKLTLYMAVSADGLTTRGETDSDWVSKNDWDEFYKYIKSSDAVIMGRKTMEQFAEDEFPIPEAVNIVLTSNKKLHTYTPSLIILESSPKGVIDLCKKRGFKSGLLIGGEYTNSKFLKDRLIDEIVLSIHPLIIGSGLTLFGTDKLDVNLKLIESRTISRELVQIRYKVIY